MYSLIIAFYLSLLGASVMILLKRREVKSGNASMVSKIGTSSDHFFHAIFSFIRKTIGFMNKKSFIALSSWIAIHVLKNIRNVYVEIKHRVISNPHGKKILDAVRGRGEVNNHGASFYLRRIADREHIKSR